MMGAFLLALDEGPDILLDQAPLMVGRQGSCDVRLDSPRVSRRHCCLAEESGEVMVRDLGSLNGTRINGRPTVAGTLRPGDELEIAHLRFRLVRSSGVAERAGDRGPGGESGPRRMLTLDG